MKFPNCLCSLRTLLTYLALFFLSINASSAPGAAVWDMPGVHGNVRDGWAPGRHWTSNPFVEGDGSWSVYHQKDDRFEKMVFGKAYGFNFAWLDSPAGPTPQNMLIGRNLHAPSPSTPGAQSLASLVTFTPPTQGVLEVSIHGKLGLRPASKSRTRVSIGVFDASPSLVRVIVGEELTRDALFTWNGQVKLEEGESVGLQITALDEPAGPAGWPVFAFDHFTVRDLGNSRFSATVPVDPGVWVARDPEVQLRTNKDGGLTLEIPAGTKSWYVIDGPSLSLPARTRYHSDRAINVTADAWPEKPGDTPIHGYALHLRAKMNGGNVQIASTSPGSEKARTSYAQNRSAHQFWDSVWELADAHRMSSWTTLGGTGKISPDCDQLNLELWLSVPKGSPAVIHLRDFQLRETFSEKHIITSTTAEIGNIFFSKKGSMNIDFARAEQIDSWEVTDRDETDRIQNQITGTGKPSIDTLALESAGIHRIEVKAIYRDKTKVDSRTTAAVVGEPLSDSIRLHSRFGLARVHGDLGLWKKSGSSWEWGIGKIQLKDWLLEKDGSILPPPHWHPLQKSTAFTDLLSVGSFPSWLYSEETADPLAQHTLHPPKDWQLYERLFEAFARANPNLPLFSTHNEANAKWRGTPEEFIKFNALMARGARRGNPNIEVSGPVDFSIQPETFRRYIQNGMFGKDGLNAVNMHAYIGATPPEGEFIERISNISALLQQAGLGKLPVYLTEFGWARGSDNRFDPISNVQDHPRYIARSLALLAAQPVDAVIWHCFRISGSVKEEDELGYNLLNSDHTPSASYVSYINAVKWLSEIKRGDARWFRFSPRLHMVLGRAPNRVIGVAWSTNGEAPFDLPGRPLRATDMMGRELPLESHVTLSPSPIFFELPAENPFINLAEEPSISAFPGQSLQTNFDSLQTPEGITAAGPMASVSHKATPGAYLLIGTGLDGTRTGLQPITVPPPLVLKALDSRLSSVCGSLEVVATVVPSVSGTLRAVLTLGTGETVNTEIPVVLGHENLIRLPVPAFQIGKRIQGEVRVELIGSIPFSLTSKLDVSALPALRLHEQPSWDRISATDFSSWSPSAKVAPRDLSATVQTAATDKGLHVRIVVTDDVHRQTRDPKSLHEEDSIQLAFDIDGDQPWKFNLIMDGSYNGHRILGYTIAKPSDGRPTIVWRNRADCSGFAGESLSPEVVADVRRENQNTLYELVFPWQSLGLEQAPPIGKQIGFSIAVNDSDQGRDRKTLRFGQGIIGPQDPRLFATLKVIEDNTVEKNSPAPASPEISLRATFPAHENHAIFQSQEPVELSVEVEQSLHQADTLLWELVNDRNESAASGEIPVPAGSQPWRTQISLHPAKAGYFAVRLKLKNSALTVPRAGSRPSGFVTFGVLPAIEKLPLKWIDDSRFGAQGTNFLETGRVGQGNPFRPLFSLLGWGWCYANYRMFELESQGPDTFKPQLLVDVLRSKPDPVAQAGLCPLVDLHGLPDWLSDRPDGQPSGKNPHRGQFYPPKDWAAFERYISSVASERAAVRRAHFPGLRHNYYDIFWEPDWHWKGSDEDFIKMFEVARRAIRSADPDGLLVGPNYGVLKKGNQLLRRLLEKGLGQHLDGITTHLYSIPYGWPEEQGLPEQVRDLVNLKQQYLRPGARILQTEWGPYYAGRSVHTGDSSAILRTHMAQALRAHLIALGEGIDCTWFFYTADQGIQAGHGAMFNLTAPNPGYGAVSVSPKPTAMAIAACTRLLEGTTSLGAVQFLDQGVMAYLFDRAGQRVLALWSVDGKQRTIRIPTGAGKVVCYDPMGNPRDLECSEGVARVEVDDVPVYVAGIAPELYPNRAAPESASLRSLPGESLPVSGLAGDEILHAFHKGQTVPIRLIGGSLSIPRNISPGKWLVAHGQTAWRGATGSFLVEVDSPVKIETKPGTKEELVLTNTLASTLTGALRFRTDGVTMNGAELTLAPGETISDTIPAQALAGAKAERPMEIEFVDQYGVPSQGPVLRHFFPKSSRTHQPMSNDGSLSGWLLEDFYTFESIENLRTGAASWSGPEDLMFRIGFRHDEERLYIAVKVRDQSHVQTQDNPQGLGREDALQIGLASRFTGGGWEVSQKLTLALRSTEGNIILHRTPHTSGLQGGSLRPSTLGAHVVREGRETRYLLAIPWAEIDPQLAPKSIPARLGIGVSVHDTDTDNNDPKAHKVMDGFGKGMESFSPEHFGVLQLSP